MSLVKKFSASVLNHPGFKYDTHIQDDRILIFSNKRPYPIRLDLYIDHILDQLSLPDDILVLAYILLEKYLQQGLLCNYNLHKIVFTSLAVCLKFVINPWISNKKLEQVGVLINGSLSSMEFTLLKFLNWKFEFKRFKQVEHELMQYIVEERIELKEDLWDEELCGEDCGVDGFSELIAFFPVEVLNSK